MLLLDRHPIVEVLSYSSSRILVSRNAIVRTMQSAPEPKSALGRYRLLAPSAALKVSPLALGTMNFGDAWYVSSIPKFNIHRHWVSI